MQLSNNYCKVTVLCRLYVLKYLWDFGEIVNHAIMTVISEGTRVDKTKRLASNRDEPLDKTESIMSVKIWLLRSL